MNKSKNFTTSFPTGFLNELEKVAKKMKLPKNDILVNAFVFWNKMKKQSMIANSYKKAGQDKEWCSLGNIGLDDWSNDILKWEK